MTPDRSSHRPNRCRTTLDGRVLLPDELPAIPYYAPPSSRPREDMLRAAISVCGELRDDTRIAHPLETVRRIDRWQISSTSGGEPSQELEWGDSGALIAEWFKTGEALPPEESEFESTERTWIAAFCDRLRRAWQRPPTVPEEPSHGELLAMPECS